MMLAHLEQFKREMTSELGELLAGKPGNAGDTEVLITKRFDRLDSELFPSLQRIVASLDESNEREAKIAEELIEKRIGAFESDFTRAMNDLNTELQLNRELFSKKMNGHFDRDTRKTNSLQSMIETVSQKVDGMKRSVKKFLCNEEEDGPMARKQVISKEKDNEKRTRQRKKPGPKKGTKSRVKKNKEAAAEAQRASRTAMLIEEKPTIKRRTRRSQNESTLASRI
eukprot:TRINITY_DN17469_c0_g1_i1.p1 TRINITY_DN17469_c0_g1~~TRINITY_DN17469_c0_g1_i1.p1  ORF type:complete len:226 (-),score=62.11 TRINITY_DN17469_c0_g1_i1:92-769(-)